MQESKIEFFDRVLPWVPRRCIATWHPGYQYMEGPARSASKPPHWPSRRARDTPAEMLCPPILLHWFEETVMALFASPVEYPLRVLAKQAELIAIGQVERVDGDVAHLRVSEAWKSTPDEPSIRTWSHAGII